MDQPLPLVRDQQKADAEHLKLLAIFHFVVAGFALLGIAFLLAHYAFMNAFFANPQMWEGQKGGPPPAEIFAIFKWIYLAGGIVFVSLGVLNVISAFSINARKRRTFSLVVAGLNCIQIPIGTALGVFTIIVLTRYSVRQLYDRGI